MKKVVALTTVVGVVVVIIVVWLLSGTTEQETNDEAIAAAKQIKPDLRAALAAVKAAELRGPLGATGAWATSGEKHLYPTSERPTHGPELLQQMKIERGSTRAVLSLTQLQIKYLKSLKEPTDEQLAELQQAEASLAAQMAQLAQQSREIDAFDPDAGPPDRSPAHGPPVALASVLNVDDQRMAKLVRDRFSVNGALPDGALAVARRESTELARRLDGLQVPAGSKPMVENMFLNFVDSGAQPGANPQSIAAQRDIVTQAMRDIAAGKRH